MLEMVTTRLESAANWGRKFSLFTYPFVTACCGMEFMSAAGPRYDIDRFGCALPRFSPRQSDLLMVVGTITHRQAPVLKKVYDQMAEPKWVIAFGACTCSGGEYAIVEGLEVNVFARQRIDTTVNELKEERAAVEKLNLV